MCLLWRTTTTTTVGIDGVLVCRFKAKGCNGDDEVIYRNKTMCINPAQSLDLNLVRNVMCGCCEEDAAICPPSGVGVRRLDQ